MMICQTIRTYCVRLTSLCFARDAIGVTFSPQEINLLALYYTQFVYKNKVHVFEKLKKSKSRGIFLSAINISILSAFAELCNSVIQICCVTVTKYLSHFHEA